MCVKNLTRDTILAKTLLTLNSHFRETLSHLNGKGLPPDCALWISPCHSIYTVGMNRPVDVVFLSKTGRVVKMLRHFPPNCVTETIPETVSVVELPPNRLEESETRLGDQLQLDPT
jgi:hypothetical protein